jgi:hypothetical protein
MRRVFFALLLILIPILSNASSSKKYALGINYPGVSFRWALSNKVDAEIKLDHPINYD